MVPKLSLTYPSPTSHIPYFDQDSCSSLCPDQILPHSDDLLISLLTPTTMPSFSMLQQWRHSNSTNFVTLLWFQSTSTSIYSRWPVPLKYDVSFTDLTFHLCSNVDSFKTLSFSQIWRHVYRSDAFHLWFVFIDLNHLLPVLIFDLCGVNHLLTDLNHLLFTLYLICYLCWSL